MKIILSRKGHDSSAGGFPSPILPDSALCSLPIPVARGTPRSRIAWGGTTLGDIASQLGNDPEHVAQGVHFDPDLRAESLPRLDGWRPSFGQTEAAQTHLERQGVGVGDLFLFYGWFRETETVRGKLRFRPRAPDLHTVFGWLQVGEILRPTTAPETVPPWAGEHPHVKEAPKYPTNNALYVARERLEIPGLTVSLPGGGTFPRHMPCLRLSAEGHSRSVWTLPHWFMPRDGRPALSYHADPQRWDSGEDRLLLQTVGRGQEFVLDCDFYPEAFGWVQGLFEAGLPAADRNG